MVSPVRADVTLDEVHVVDLGKMLSIESHSSTAISGDRARIESAQTIRSPMSSVPDEGTVSTVRIVRGDLGKEYTYVVGTPQYWERELQIGGHDEPKGAGARAPANCSPSKVTLNSKPSAPIAGLATNEATVVARQECKDPASTHMCKVVLTTRRWVTASVPFATETSGLSRSVEPEFGGLYGASASHDPLVAQARESLRVFLNAPLNAQLWNALDSKVRTLKGVTVKSTFELAATPCYPLAGDGSELARQGAPQFANMMLGMLSGVVMMEWAQKNAAATQPAALYSQSSELTAIHTDAVDPAQLELPSNLTKAVPRTQP